ncbi:hypothetical protein SAMN05421788_10277 [Filimonas lacunae]|uniref:Uncharacterized protein n=2 Tax=Filimonas lacunae TaxID=477680 RepID=A0A173MIH4_9BACT|nr:hypothetical protein FLA_3322 [Filimonas lacunae]SIS91761.1 hypothetical protein SAMN05421788_10277 [Filimonas lacunae]
MVEEWLLKPQHQAEFERFLESYWEEHTGEEESRPPAPEKGALRLRYLPRMVAAAAILGAVAFSVYYFAGTNTSVESHQEMAVVKVIPEQVPAAVNVDTTRVLPKAADVKKTKTKQYGKKPLPTQAVVPVIVEVKDTAAPPATPPKAMKMTAFKKIMFNDSAFSKLSKADQILVSNQMLLRVNFSNASFNDLVATFRDRYGIVLELCAGTTPDQVMKAYTGSFAKITLPELISDMSTQMLFSYTVSNNVVKVCFN